MNLLRLILMIVAIVFLALAAIGTVYPRFNFLAGGLTLWAIATLIT